MDPADTPCRHVAWDSCHSAQTAPRPSEYDIRTSAAGVRLRLLEVGSEHPRGLQVADCHVPPREMVKVRRPSEQQLPQAEEAEEGHATYCPRNPTLRVGQSFELSLDVAK